ncbi:MAG: hypothetical protein ABJ275_03830 [Maricaulaceae bacterium]
MYKITKIGAVACVLALAACSTTEVKDGTLNAPKDIANAPVKALNLKNTKIPDYLVDAKNPYADARSLSCADLSGEIDQLTEFVGPDWDDADHYSKIGRKKGNLFDAVLPYGGLVRFASGASKHEKKVLQAADYAGVRRTYLKTVRSNKGCS